MARAVGLRLGFVHLQRATVHLVAIEALDGAGGVRIRHLDEAEAARTTGVTVVDQGDGLDGAVRREQRADGGLVGRERKVSNVDLAHLVYSLNGLPGPHWRRNSGAAGPVEAFGAARLGS